MIWVVLDTNVIGSVLLQPDLADDEPVICFSERQFGFDLTKGRSR